MRHRLYPLAALFLAGIAPAGCARSSADKDDGAGGWRPLIADDLSDTTLAGKNADRAWTLESHGSWRGDIDRMLFTREDYENFVLELEFNNSPGTNGGVILYCSDVANWIPNSVEVQIADDTDPKWRADPKTRCAAFYGRRAPTAFLVKKPGEWNRCAITCAGRKVTVELNGETVNRFDLAEFKDAKTNPDGSKAPAWLSKPPAGLPPKGRIGFQGKHGDAPIRYRNIRIRALTEAEMRAGQASR